MQFGKLGARFGRLGSGGKSRSVAVVFPPSSVVASFSDDGANSPFYGIDTFPNAVYDSSTNRTYMVWEAWRGYGREQNVRYYDHSTGLFSSSYVAGYSPLTDDAHGINSLFVDQHGHVHIIGGAHGGQQFHFSTITAGDISAWAEQPLPPIVGTYSASAFVTSNCYVFYRDAGSFYMVVAPSTSIASTGKVTWGSAVNIFGEGASTDFFEVSMFQIVSGKIHMIFSKTESADHSNQWNTYFAIYDPATGNINNLAGNHNVVPASQPINIADTDTYFKIQTTAGGSDAGGSVSISPQFCWDAGGNLHVLYADGTYGSSVTLYHMATADNGSNWTTPAALATLPGTFACAAITQWSDGGVVAYWEEGTSGGFTGDVYVNKRSSGIGGTWGTKTKIQTAATFGLGSMTPVLNGVAAARALWCEVNPTNTDAAAGSLKSYLYGESGFKGQSFSISQLTAPVWNPLNKDSNLTISGAGLTVTSGAGAGFDWKAICTVAIALNEKIYFEVVADQLAAASQNYGIGLVDLYDPVTQAAFVGQTSHSIGYYGNGRLYINNAFTNKATYAVNGSNVGFAVDGVNKKVWVRVNGGNWHNDVIANQNPATNTGGTSVSSLSFPVYPAVDFSNNTMQATAKFASASWTYAAPSGFSAMGASH